MIRLEIIYKKMKKNNLIVTATLMCLFINTSCRQVTENDQALVKSNKDSLLKIEMPDAACNDCKQVVEDGLANKKGVKQSQLSLKKKELSIIYDPMSISEDKLKLIVTNLTYKMPCKKSNQLRIIF